MSRRNIDIDDNEIRVISPDGGRGIHARPRRLFFIATACATVAIVALAIALI